MRAWIGVDEHGAACGHPVLFGLMVFILTILGQSSTYSQDRGQDLVQEYRFGRDDDIEKTGWPRGFRRNVDVQFPKYLPMKIVAKRPENQNAIENIRRLMARCWIAMELGKMPWEVFPERVPVQIDRMLETFAVSDSCFEIRMDGGAAEVFAPSFKLENAFSYAYEFAIQTKGLDGFQAGCELVLYEFEPKPGEMQAENIVKIVSSELTTGDHDWKVVHIDPFQMESVNASYGQLRFFVRPTGQNGFSGSVRFDDVRVLKMPQLSMSLNRPIHLYHGNDPIEVNCTASGLHSEVPNIELEIINQYGDVLKKNTLELNESFPERARPPNTSGYLPVAANMPSSWKGHAKWALPKLDPGYYRLRCVLSRTSNYSFTDEVAFCILDSDCEGDSRFGWSLPLDQINLPVNAIPGLLQNAGVRSVKIPIWYDPEDNKRADEIAWLVERLKTLGISTIGVLDLPPTKYRKRFAGSELNIANILEREDIWPNLLEPVLSQLSMDIDTIQIGWDQDDSFSGNLQLDDRVQTLRDQLNLFRPSSQLVVPWLAIHESTDSKVVSHRQYFMKPTWSPQELRHFIQYRQRQKKDRSSKAANAIDDEEWVGLDSIDVKRYPLDQRLTHLVESMIAVIQGGGSIGWVASPFDPAKDWMKSEREPGSLFLPFRNLSMAMREHVYAGHLSLPHRSPNHLLARGEHGLLVVWNPNAIQEVSYLGENVTATDLYGKSILLETETTDGGIVHKIPTSSYPILIEGVDMAVAQWRMGLSIENPILETTRNRTQVLNIHFENPTRQAIVGKIRVQAPDILDSPSVQSIKLAPQSSNVIPIEVELLPNATAKKTKLQFDIDVQGNRPYAFSELRDIQVGLSDIDLQVDPRFDESGNLLLAIEILNRTGRQATFECTLYMPSRSYERMFIKNVGDRMVKTMLIPNGREFENKTLWMKCEEVETKRIVNQQLLIAPSTID